MQSIMTYLAGRAGPEVAGAAVAWLALRHRLARLQQEAGMTTETVIITAGLGALAVALVVIIGNRVRSRAQSIP